MMTNACFLNFTAAVKLQPPSLKVRRPGMIIRLCRDVANIRLLNAVDDYCSIKSSDIFLLGKHDTPKTYYTTVDGTGLGNFEFLKSNYGISEMENDSRMIINKGDINKVRKRIDTLLPTSTIFGMSTFILAGLDFHKLSIKGWINFDQTFVKSYEISKCPFSVLGCGVIAYTVEQKGNKYVHKLLLTSQEHNKAEQLFVSIPESFEEGFIARLRSSILRGRNITEGIIRELNATDSISLTLVDSNNDFHLEYSSTSMATCIRTCHFRMPYAYLPMKDIEPTPKLVSKTISKEDFINIRRALNTIFDFSLDEASVATTLTTMLNDLELPCPDEDYERVKTTILELLEDELSQKVLKAIRDAMIRNKDYVLMLLILKFSMYYKSTPVIDRVIRSHNFSKSKKQRLFSLKTTHRVELKREPIRDTTQIIEEQQRIMAPSLTANSNVLALNFSLDLDSDDDEDFQEMIQGNRPLLTTQPVTQSIAGGAPTLLSSLNMLDIFSIDEPISEAEAIEREEEEILTPVTSNISADDDSAYVNNAKTLISRILLESNALVTVQIRSTDFVNSLSVGGFSYDTINSIIQIMTKYSSLDKLALMLIMFKSSV